MRFIVILSTALLCCTIVVNAKNHSGEKIYQKKRLHNYDEPKKCKEGSCGYKKVEKYKETGENEDFRWNKNFKNHKNNIYDVDKKNTESVYKPKYKKVKEQMTEPKKHYKKNVQENKKKHERKMQMEKTPSSEASEISEENVKEPSKEIQCDVSENTCRIE